jgi:hypothetical protein
MIVAIDDLSQEAKTIASNWAQVQGIQLRELRDSEDSWFPCHPFVSFLTDMRSRGRGALKSRGAASVGPEGDRYYLLHLGQTGFSFRRVAFLTKRTGHDRHAEGRGPDPGDPGCGHPRPALRQRAY